MEGAENMFEGFDFTNFGEFIRGLVNEDDFELED